MTPAVNASGTGSARSLSLAESFSGTVVIDQLDQRGRLQFTI